MSISCRDAPCAQACAGVLQLVNGRLLDLNGSDVSQRDAALAKLAVAGRRLLLAGSRPADLFRSYVDSCRALRLDERMDWGSLVVLYANADGALQEKTISTDMSDWLRRVTPLQKWQEEVAKLVTRPITDARIIAEGRGADLACGE